MYEPELREQISQGDIFARLPVALVRYSQGSLIADIREVNAILLTRDCEFDKPANRYVTVAEVRPLAAVDSGSRGNVRANKALNAFYLEALADVLPESYVDFRLLGQMEKRILADRAQAGGRLLSVSDDVKLGLQNQLALFFSKN